MQQNPLEQRIDAIIRPVLLDMGFDLLWVEFKAGTLSVFAENPKTGKISLDECSSISREISPLLEVEDPINGAYRLEVSSAGIDRPLFKPQDYHRFIDLEVKIELDEAVNEQKRFRGWIRNVMENSVEIESDQGMVTLPFPSIIKAKLVMNDNLIKETKKRFEAAHPQVADAQNDNETTKIEKTTH